MEEKPITYKDMSNVLNTLKAYLLLPESDRIQFLNQITEIEKMDKMVRQDYTKSLLSRRSHEKGKSDLSMHDSISV